MTISVTNGADAPKQTLIFSYGTLKQGFSNHKLMQDLISKNDAVFVGNYITDRRLPLVRGPYGVPFLLNLPGASRHRVRGELYSVSDAGLQRLDVLEGITLGHYERLPIAVQPEGSDAVVEAEAYYAHRNFAEDMWRRSGYEGFEAFSDEVAKGYVRRDLRPKDRSFREQITLFCSSS
ncbi:putative gamma-glutamylcyclotransferase [Helianthus annuus]|nr:putative gamma-glutamylcyclotransferase [Helianthus annuus]KAJ0602355.1 putative gamma-glutamylcyclotransferase [Helianthus annuus]KAJ0609238.1 putative gamma-glutamylcyclotransferase [Helianthus annuus]KAJ0937144.1 putative gamma-glutamylcyclotransferase [Helianthus annuus]KAJ0945085.1 putative gamma-glutamylcyclotransferase [Helianthus annuus]